VPSLALDDDDPIGWLEAPAELVGGDEAPDSAAEDEDGPGRHQRGAIRR
jgi:hypothetical protein